MSYFMIDEYKNMEPYIPGEMPHDRKYIKLNANESSFPPSPAVLRAMDAARVNSIAHYSDPNCTELREAIGEVYGFGADQIFVGNGADEVLSFAMMTFFRAGMKICFPDITYDFYRTWSKTYRLDYKQFPVDDDLKINADDYVNTDRDVIFANPNNPTGQAIPVSDIERIVRANPKRLVIIDEAYVDYGNESCLPLVKKYNNLLVVQTFSKSRNMPGARIGFGIGSADMIHDMNMIKSVFSPFNMSTLALAGGTAVVRDTEYFKKYISEIIDIREDFEDSLEAMGYNVMRTSTNFAFFKQKAVPAKVLCDELKKRGILVRHFNMPRVDEYLRVTIGTEEEMKQVLAALSDIEEKYDGKMIA